MLKKICFLSLLALFSTTAFGMLITPQDLLKHIRTETSHIKRAHNIARAKIKKASDDFPKPYEIFKPIIDKIITSDTFKQKISQIIDEEYNAITTNLMSYNQAKKDISFDIFFPTVTIKAYGKLLFSSMARKYATLQLAEKLMNKMQELQKNIILEKTDSQPQE